MKVYTVALTNDDRLISTGTIDSDTLGGQSASDLIGERMQAHTHDENGNQIVVEGISVEETLS